MNIELQRFILIEKLNLHYYGYRSRRRNIEVDHFKLFFRDGKEMYQDK